MCVLTTQICKLQTFLLHAWGEKKEFLNYLIWEVDCIPVAFDQFYPCQHTIVHKCVHDSFLRYVHVQFISLLILQIKYSKQFLH